jgi:diacylglycerol kinase
MGSQSWVKTEGLPDSVMPQEALPPVPQTLLSTREPVEPADNPRPPRSWRHKFKVALRGLKLGIRGHSSFSVHFFFAALVIAAAIVFRCTLYEWCLLLGCIGLVLTAELFNSALETLFRGLDEGTKSRVWPCLDIGAGAVLLAAITASIIGTILFVSKLAGWLSFPTM